MKKATFTISTIVYMLCCLYYSVFCAFNGINAVRDLLYKPYESDWLLINEGSLAYLFHVSLLCACALTAISILTKADPWALGLWSIEALFAIVFTTLDYREYHFSVITFLFLAEIAYAGFVLIKKIKSLE